MKTKYKKTKLLIKINRAGFKAISFFKLTQDLDLVPLKILRLFFNKTYKKIIVYFNKLKWKRINNKIKNIQLKYKIKSTVNRLKKMEKIQKMAKNF